MNAAQIRKVLSDNARKAARARAAALSPERRREIAILASNAAREKRARDRAAASQE